MSNTETKARLEFIDVMKGIAIIVIVMYHVLLPSEIRAYSDKCVGSFVIMFFCLSGYFYSPGKKTYKQNLAARFKGLMIPFFKYSLILWAIGTVYHMIADGMTFTDALCCLRNFYGGCIWNRVIQNLFGWDYHHLGSLYMFLADFWFLLALFFAFVLFFAIADRAFESNVRFCIKMASLLIIEVMLLAFNIVLPYNLHMIPYFTMLLLAGAFFRKVDLFGLVERKWGKSADRIIGVLLIVLSVVISCLYPDNADNMFRGSFGERQIPSMLVLTVDSFLMIWGLGIVTRRMNLDGLRIKEISYVGKNSMFIFLFHVAFAYFISVLTGFKLASFYEDTMPTVGNQILGFLLAVVCILLSLGLNVLTEKISTLIKH